MVLRIVACAAAVAVCCGFDNLDYGCPGRADQVVDRVGYALGYSEKHEQPLWVSYRLTRDEVVDVRVPRNGSFVADAEIRTGSASSSDYAGSGYDRGHLAPARDMQFSGMTMRESFYMSNMSPQTPKVNRGIWARIEDFARECAKSEGAVVIVTGPIFGKNPERIGKNGVSVPDAFYKVIFDETPPCKMFAFIVPNRFDGLPHSAASYACSVDEVEAATGLDFFSSLPEEQERRLESEVQEFL